MWRKPKESPVTWPSWILWQLLQLHLERVAQAGGPGVAPGLHSEQHGLAVPSLGEGPRQKAPEEA